MDTSEFLLGKRSEQPATDKVIESVKKGDTERVKELLEAGADIIQDDSEGNTPGGGV